LTSATLRGLLALACLLQLPTPVRATTIVLDDERSIAVDSFYSCGITSCSLSVFKSAIHDGVSPTFVAGRVGIDSYVFQNSSISPAGIFGLGLAQSEIAVDILEIDAESVLSITFELTEATPYYLFGSVDVSVDALARNGIGSATVLLSDAGGAIHGFSASATSGTESQPFGEGGVLSAGVYTLFAEAFQGPNADGTSSAFEVHLALPEPGTALVLVSLLLVATRFVGGVKSAFEKSRSGSIATR
jgi:hypothetical protein